MKIRNCNNGDGQRIEDKFMKLEMIIRNNSTCYYRWIFYTPQDAQPVQKLARITSWRVPCQLIITCVKFGMLRVPEKLKNSSKFYLVHSNGVKRKLTKKGTKDKFMKLEMTITAMDWGHSVIPKDSVEHYKVLELLNRWWLMNQHTRIRIDNKQSVHATIGGSFIHRNGTETGKITSRRVP
ncbi:hypothetical protein RCL_jg4961.t1 [Rhizophagus clarus]|uniref:Uncharacterized protein n=1 Tax=Rhizophagus clarus TaxID=94130 RepID=A0A8H3LB28_9GLOM|nr:hypothetical protein RCL_jg4961.t1 [Rhizophagus clarus]